MWSQAQAQANEMRIRKFVAFLPEHLSRVADREARYGLNEVARRTANRVDDLELVLVRVSGSSFEFSVRVWETRQVLYTARVESDGSAFRAMVG